MVLFDRQSATTHDSNSKDASNGTGETVITILIFFDRLLMNLMKYRTLSTFSWTVVVLNRNFSANTLEFKAVGRGKTNSPVTLSKNAGATPNVMTKTSLVPIKSMVFSALQCGGSNSLILSLTDPSFPSPMRKSTKALLAKVVLI